jgi:hypothetical protein
MLLGRHKIIETEHPGDKVIEVKVTDIPKRGRRKHA